jgi:hypothetical protein
MGTGISQAWEPNAARWTLDFHPQTTLSEVNRFALRFNCEAFMTDLGQIALRPRNPRAPMPTIEELAAAF